MHTCHYMRFDEHGQVITDIIKDGVRVDSELADDVSAENYKAAKARVSQLWHKPTQDELKRLSKLAEEEQFRDTSANKLKYELLKLIRR